VWMRRDDLSSGHFVSFHRTCPARANDPQT
jgi:hypothetical protein